MTSLERPNIHEFLDYRAFLRAFYDHKKEVSSGFSHRTFARLAGLKSSNFLKLVMSGKRNLSIEGIHRFAKALKFTKSETHFFEILVHFNQAKTVEEKNRYYERLAQFKNYNEIKSLEASQYAYFSNWYFVALRELVTLKNFKEDVRWINKALKTKFSSDEIKRAIKILIELKLLERGPDGLLKQTIEQVSTTPEIASLSVINFHREMLKKASESLETTPMRHRDISALTVAISQDQFEEIKQRINQFRRELHAIANQSKNRQAIYQINFQFFNLSEVVWE